MGTKMKIALCVIATGKYARFVVDLIASASMYFCSDHDTEFYLFTDSSMPPLPARLWPAKHEPWPGPTLHRYSTMLTAEKELAKFDYVFYCDVDMLFVAPVGSEICGPGLTATIHPGYAGQTVRQRLDQHRAGWLYELNPRSNAYAQPDDRFYTCGGFQGGESHAYLAAMRDIAAAIADDEQRGIVARWHDESHWNRYLIDHPPVVLLDSLYCSPESWNAPGRKLVALDKNHKEFQVT